MGNRAGAEGTSAIRKKNTKVVCIGLVGGSHHEEIGLAVAVHVGGRKSLQLPGHIVGHGAAKRPVSIPQISRKAGPGCGYEVELAVAVEVGERKGTGVTPGRESVGDGRTVGTIAFR